MESAIPLHPPLTPSYIRYYWDQLPYDASLAEALKDHLMPPQEGKSLLDILNESAKKNKASTATWKPGTLDVLALAKGGLEALNSLDRRDAIQNTIKALPQMRDQEQAQEFTRKLVPLLFNWAQSTTRKGLSDPDFTKDQCLFKFVLEINKLQSDNPNNIGIQHALYQALLPNIYDAFDRALPACQVKSIADELKEIGDKLLNAEHLENDPSFDRDEITRRQARAKLCYEAAGDRMTQDIAREAEIRQGAMVPEDGAARIEVVEEGGIHIPPRIWPPSLSTPSTPNLPTTHLPTFSFSSNLVAPLLSASDATASQDVVSNGSGRNIPPTDFLAPTSTNSLSEITALRDTTIASENVTPTPLAVEGDASTHATPMADAEQRTWAQMSTEERRTWTDNLGKSTRGQRAAELLLNKARKLDCISTTKEKERKRTAIKQKYLDKGR